MARKKEFKEEDVIYKAMNLFWKNGYNRTSMNMLVKEMGINRFTIYSNFGNKNDILLESIKLYKSKLDNFIDTLKTSSNGLHGIKQYFYDFIEFTKETDFGKGCLLTSTMNELGTSADDSIKEIISDFNIELNQVFTDKLSQNKTKSKEIITQQVDYLILSIMSLSFATRVFNKSQLSNYIENVFKNL